jgi:hypothetical protein
MAGEEVSEDRGRLIYKGARTTMISTQVLNRGVVGVRSRADVVWSAIPRAFAKSRQLLSQSNSPRTLIPNSTNSNRLRSFMRSRAMPVTITRMRRMQRLPFSVGLSK